MEFKSVKIKKPQEINLILGQSHFIKSVEDIFEVMVNNVPGVKFGLAFVESSGACKVRVEGTDEELKKLAGENALNLGCGHSFIILMRDSYPINVLNAIKSVPEVCNIFCATANTAEVVIAESETGRGIMGVIDGAKPKGLENKEDIAWRKDLLRSFGYKL
ncbi:MAG: adenosine-specific kinase [Candidatus Omnitrophica bacterium]|nr:adenosine-specific kinase [Candidatus Omnitrophota bacterium]